MAVRPNTPVMPFATPAKKASYIDPTVSIKTATRSSWVFKALSGLMPRLMAGAAIKIGNLSDVLDNASIIADGGRGNRGPKS